jgi:hypothetical protein
MRQTDTTISGQESFIPWVNVGYGGEIGSGILTLRAPRVNVNFSVTLPGDVTDKATWLANNQVPTSQTAEITAQTREFTSRVISSYSVFNEIFDSPFGLASDSPLVYDISPADGQQITGILPFFAMSTFTDATAEDMIIVFKQDSIHVLNLADGTQRRLETHGVGCAAPFSIAYSRNGIIFAHSSGIYRLNRDLTISYVGKYMERRWNKNVGVNDITLATGRNSALSRRYELSVPAGDNQTQNNQVFVYDYSRETDQRVEFGAWTRYDNFPVTGWANLPNDSFFGTYDGQVYRLRNANDASDYRDDTAAINQEITYAASDFGLPGIIKVVKNAALHFRPNLTPLQGVEVSAANNLDNVFRRLDNFTFSQDTNDAGLDGEVSKKILTIRYELPRRRLEYLQLKITNDTIDETMVLAGMTFNVGVSSVRTIPSAAQVQS